MVLSVVCNGNPGETLHISVLEFEHVFIFFNVYIQLIYCEVILVLLLHDAVITFVVFNIAK